MYVNNIRKGDNTNKKEKRKQVPLWNEHLLKVHFRTFSNCPF